MRAAWFLRRDGSFYLHCGRQSTMSLYHVKVSLKLRADAALSPIYASYKELQSDWRWIHSMDPEAAAAAD